MENKSQEQTQVSKKSLLPTVIIAASIVVAGLVGGISVVVGNVYVFKKIGPQVSTGSPANVFPQNEPVKVSVDDDPILGSKDAPITLIEFLDFECPFCKQSFQETLPKIIKEYVDTGKVKFVVRDYPLDFHKNAIKEAEAASCAREQGGDSAYFKYHDEVFKRTESNGEGLGLDQLPVIAKDTGLDTAKFKICLDSGKFKGEIDKDIKDGSNAGVGGTPHWFVGKSTADGVIDGIRVDGAAEFETFQKLIDEQLKK